MIEDEIKKLVAAAMSESKCPECEGRGEASYPGFRGYPEQMQCRECKGSGLSLLARIERKLDTREARRESAVEGAVRIQSNGIDHTLIHLGMEYPLIVSNTDRNKNRFYTVSMCVQDSFLSFTVPADNWISKAEKVIAAYLEAL